MKVRFLWVSIKLNYSLPSPVKFDQYNPGLDSQRWIAVHALKSLLLSGLGRPRLSVTIASLKQTRNSYFCVTTKTQALHESALFLLK